MNLYTNCFNGLDYYQINSKRDSNYTGCGGYGSWIYSKYKSDQLPTFIFNFNVITQDKINLIINFSKESCAGVLKLLLLSPNGRVIYSFVSKNKQFKDLYDFDNSKRKTNIIFNGVPGKYTLKYWAVGCEDCRHDIILNSINNIKSVNNCGMKLIKKKST